MTTRPAETLPVFAPGDHVDHYVIRRSYRSGGIQKSYVAEHSLYPRAVELVFPSWGPRTNERFRRWLEHVCHLSHPNIVPVYDYGLFRGHPYAVLQYVGSRTLSDLIRTDDAPGLAGIVQLFRTLSSALGHCHENGVAHRNLKTQAIRVGDSGFPFLSDFLVASSLFGDPVDADGFFLTPTTASPEILLYRDQLSDDWHRSPVNLARSDVWSAGLLLYRSLTGEQPFRREKGESSWEGALQRIASPEPVDMGPLEGRAPVPLVDVVKRCLAKNASERYPDGTALAAALERTLEHLGRTAASGQQADEPRPGRGLLLPLDSGVSGEPTRYVTIRTEAFLGQGATADVYLVSIVSPSVTGPNALETTRHASLHHGDQIALKLLRRELSSDPRVVARFTREARYLCALRSGRVVRAHGSGVLSGRPFVALEYLDGPTLAQRITQGTVPWKEASRIVRSLAEGLQQIHGAGLVHRDLKPQNIILITDGQPVIADFGLAHREASENLTVRGDLLGTPAYSCPEQLRGDEPGPEWDLYSLGVIFYELVAGHPPHEARSMPELVHQILTRPVPSLQIECPGIPRPVGELVTRLLARDPADRASSACDVIDMLSDVLSDSRPRSTT